MAVEKGMEHKREQQRYNQDASFEATAINEKACLRTKQR